MMDVVYLNGKYVRKDRARVSFLDHGLLYGDGVFETIRSYDGRVFGLTEHYNRLRESAGNIFLKIPLKLNDLIIIINSLLRKNKLNNAYIRITVTRGEGEPGLSAGKCGKPTVIVYAKRINTLPGVIYKRGVDLVTVKTKKKSGRSIKSCNFLDNIRAAREVETREAYEGIMFTTEGWVSEGTVSNIFFVKNGSLITPPLSAGALGGITRKAVIGIAGKAGIKVEEKKVRKPWIYTADECFITNTMVELLPVRRIDGKRIGRGVPGTTTKILMKGFGGLVEALKRRPNEK